MTIMSHEAWVEARDEDAHRFYVPDVTLGGDTGVGRVVVLVEIDLQAVARSREKI